MNVDDIRHDYLKALNADNLIFWRTFNELHPQRERAVALDAQNLFGNVWAW